MLSVETKTSIQSELPEYNVNCFSTSLIMIYSKFPNQMSCLNRSANAIMRFCMAAMVCGSTYAADSLVVIGKNDWLFARHETVLESLDKDAQASFDLIERINRIFARNGITLVVAVVPSKMEIHSEQLPDDFKVTPYMSGFNATLQGKLRANGVQVIDLKKSMREAALRDIDNPLFFRLDTHWTHTGALVAAQTIHAGLQDNPALKKALEVSPVESYQLAWSTKKYRQNKIRDIVNLLPKEMQTFAPEETKRFSVTQENSAKVPLLGDIKGGGLTLIGSSNSGEWLGFPDALRFSLQRSIFNFSLNADVGLWVTMRTYLQDDAFQTSAPKLLIWEIPERAIGFGPNRFRLPRYQIGNAEWLLQAAALIEGRCERSATGAKLDSSGIRSSGTARVEPSTQDKDYVEISFDQPVDVSSYFSARLKTDGSKQVTVEAWDQSTLVRKFVVDTAGDDRDHAFKTPLVLGNKGVNRLKFFPGQTTSFSLKDINICRYQENWVKNMLEP